MGVRAMRKGIRVGGHVHRRGETSILSISQRPVLSGSARF